MKVRKCAVPLFTTVCVLLTISVLIIGCEQHLLKNMKTGDVNRSTKVIGIGESRPGVLYAFGTIIVQYDKETWQQVENEKHIPIASVNDFLVNKGYTPKVRGRSSAKLLEIIDIEKHVDPSSLLGELHTIPGVVSVELNRLNEQVALLTRGGLPRGPMEPKIRPLTPDKVGEIDGKLFELGVVLITYDYAVSLTPAGAPVNAVFQLLFDKGYEPIEKDLLLPIRIQVIDISEHSNPLPLFEALMSINGVVSIQLNILHESADLLLNEVTDPWR